MTDEELLAAVEARVLFAMLEGCMMYDYLGRKVYNPGSWVATLRADHLSRLIDMARSLEKGQS
jgi:hypothetical protein